VLAVAREDRAALEAALGETVTAQANATAREERSQNVVAREGERCRLIIGAHYDSVTAGPGANDNASGTATMLELARVHRTDGLCAIAFGAEEIGLFGSRAYVQQSDLAGLEYVLNFDMTGKLTGGTIVGTQTLQQKVLDLLRAEGEVPLRAGSFGARTSSDHASFIDAGIPAVTFNSGNDEFIHTEHDDMDNVDRDSLRTMLAAGDVAVRGLLEEIGAPVR
jgi:aminopeptidase YwaD